MPEWDGKNRRSCHTYTAANRTVHTVIRDMIFVWGRMIVLYIIHVNRTEGRYLSNAQKEWSIYSRYDCISWHYVFYFFGPGIYKTKPMTLQGNKRAIFCFELVAVCLYFLFTPQHCGRQTVRMSETNQHLENTHTIILNPLWGAEKTTSLGAAVILHRDHWDCTKQWLTYMAITRLTDTSEVIYLLFNT